MVNRLVVKCEVCEAVTLIRLQLGPIEQHPLRICCGRCKILITARIDIVHPDKEQKAVFDNAQPVESANIDYCIQASPEFVTDKLQPMPAKEPAGSFSSYMAAFRPMGPEGYDAFIRTTTQFLHFAKTEWPKVRRINELWLSRQLPLLAKELGTLFPSEQYPVDNELRGLMVVYRLNLLLHQPILQASRFRAASKLIFSAQESFSPEQRNELAKLGRDWVRRGIFQRLDERLLGLTGQMVERFQYLIPAFGLRFYRELPPELLIHKGMTTASFEDIKQLFVDAHELAGDLLPLVAAWNNVRHRGQWSQMAPGRSDVQTLAHLEHKPKGARFRFITGKEDFDQLIHNRVDIALRNAIAHGTYRYEGIGQSIEFYPGGHEGDPTDKRTTYLLEFASKCLDLYQSVRDLAFLMYQTHRWVLAVDGQAPLPMPDDEEAPKQRAPAKVGRNDPCSCGSGKKYKRCHGS